MDIPARLKRFIFKRQTLETAPITLRWRRIYILPTRHGFIFALNLLLLFIGSINYTLSLGYVLTFFLAAIGIVAMLHTFRNLRDLKISWRLPTPVFASDTAIFTLLFENPDKNARFAINIIDQENNYQSIDVVHSTSADISRLAEKRGMLLPGRIIIETRYPLGLFYAWAQLMPDVFCTVYPVPSKDKIPLPVPVNDKGHSNITTAGDEELQHLRPYRPGDSMRRIAWHAFARERGLLTKQFFAQSGGDIWFNLQQAPEAGIEAKLSRLTRWIIDADAAGTPYGLQLPGSEFPPAIGQAHLQRCLEALASYDEASRPYSFTEDLQQSKDSSFVAVSTSG